MSTVVDFGFLWNSLSQTSIFGINYLIPLLLVFAGTLLVTRTPQNWAFIMFPMVLAMEDLGVNFGPYMYPLVASVTGIVFVVMAVGPSVAADVMRTWSTQGLPGTAKRKEQLIKRDAEAETYREYLEDRVPQGETMLSTHKLKRDSERTKMERDLLLRQLDKGKRDRLSLFGSSLAEMGIDSETIGMVLTRLSKSAEYLDIKGFEAAIKNEYAKLMKGKGASGKKGSSRGSGSGPVSRALERLENFVGKT